MPSTALDPGDIAPETDVAAVLQEFHGPVEKP